MSHPPCNIVPACLRACAFYSLHFFVSVSVSLFAKCICICICFCIPARRCQFCQSIAAPLNLVIKITMVVHCWKYRRIQKMKSHRFSTDEDCWHSPLSCDRLQCVSHHCSIHPKLVHLVFGLVLSYVEFLSTGYSKYFIIAPSMPVFHMSTQHSHHCTAKSSFQKLIKFDITTGDQHPHAHLQRLELGAHGCERLLGDVAVHTVGRWEHHHLKSKLFKTNLILALQVAANVGCY